MPATMLTNNNEQILNPVPTGSPDLSIDLQYLTVIGIFQARGIRNSPVRQVQSKKTEIHAPGFLEFAKQILFYGAHMCAVFALPREMR